MVETWLLQHLNPKKSEKKKRKKKEKKKDNEHPIRFSI